MLFLAHCNFKLSLFSFLTICQNFCFLLSLESLVLSTKAAWFLLNGLIKIWGVLFFLSGFNFSTQFLAVFPLLMGKQIIHIVFLPHPEQSPFVIFPKIRNCLKYLWMIYIHSPVDSFHIFYISRKLAELSLEKKLSLGTVCLQFFKEMTWSFIATVMDILSSYVFVIVQP